MTDNEANELRVLANEVMRRLFEGGHREQLNILKAYAKIAIEHLDEKTKKNK